jgi:hypothetical protein
VTERQRDIRAADILDRSHNGSGYNSRVISQSRSDDDEGGANYAYRGNHRAESQHQADDREPARQRDSRVGRHHAEHYDDQAAR